MKNLYQKSVEWLIGAVHGVLAFLLEVVEAALTKFSKINLVHYIAIGTVIVELWFENDLINDAWVYLLTGAMTVILNIWASTTKLVDTGFEKAGWAIWFTALCAIALGGVDLIFADKQYITELFGEHTKIAMMTYLTIMVLFRTGFGNQKVR